MKTKTAWKVLNKEMQKLMDKIAKEMNDKIKEGIEQGAHWICFKNSYEEGQFTLISKCFRNKIENIGEWDDIFDLKQYIENLKNYQSISIELEYSGLEEE